MVVLHLTNPEAAREVLGPKGQVEALGDSTGQDRAADTGEQWHRHDHVNLAAHTTQVTHVTDNHVMP